MVNNLNKEVVVPLLFIFPVDIIASRKEELIMLTRVRIMDKHGRFQKKIVLLWKTTITTQVF